MERKRLPTDQEQKKQPKPADSSYKIAAAVIISEIITNGQFGEIEEEAIKRFIVEIQRLTSSDACAQFRSEHPLPEVAQNFIDALRNGLTAEANKEEKNLAEEMRKYDAIDKALVFLTWNWPRVILDEDFTSIGSTPEGIKMIAMANGCIYPATALFQYAGIHANHNPHEGRDPLRVSGDQFKKRDLERLNALIGQQRVPIEDQPQIIEGGQIIANGICALLVGGFTGGVLGGFFQVFGVLPLFIAMPISSVGGIAIAVYRVAKKDRWIDNYRAWRQLINRERRRDVLAQAVGENKDRERKEGERERDLELKEVVVPIRNEVDEAKLTALVSKILDVYQEAEQRAAKSSGQTTTVLVARELDISPLALAPISPSPASASELSSLRSMDGASHEHSARQDEVTPSLRIEF